MAGEFDRFGAGAGRRRRALYLSRAGRLPAGRHRQVPLGTRDVVGVVWDDPPDPSVGHNRLRPINGTFDAPPLIAEIRRFVDWVADYTLTSARHGAAHGAAGAGGAGAGGAGAGRAASPDRRRSA